MIYKQIYYTPNDFDNMLMTSNGKVLTGLCFIDSHEQTHQQIDCESKNLAIFKDTCHWLDIYFTGKQPNFMPTYEVENMTLFRKEVFDIMLSIPFGKVMTYGDIATKIAISHGIKKCLHVLLVVLLVGIHFALLFHVIELLGQIKSLQVMVEV